MGREAQVLFVGLNVVQDMVENGEHEEVTRKIICGESHHTGNGWRETGSG